MKSVLEKTKASGGTITIDNEGLFPEVFEKTIKCRVGTLENGSVTLIPIGKRGKPTRVSFQGLSLISTK
ncbi:MAG TPA: hypothetical protein PKU93_01365 [Candidatus Pacearchaeota archaeon]|nr:hypothetical protein [Candidatus Pacearchaeota archaeon]